MRKLLQKTKVLLVMALLSAGTSAWGDIVNTTLSPSADTYFDWTDDATKATSHGSDETFALSAGWSNQWTSATPGLKDGKMIAVFKFDVSAYKGKIVGATFKVHATNTNDNGSGLNIGYFDSTTWTEETTASTAGMTTRSATDLNIHPFESTIYPYYCSATIAKNTTTPTEISLSNDAMVNYFNADEDGIVTIFLYCTTRGSTIYSKDNATESYRPQLVLNYSNNDTDIYTFKVNNIDAGNNVIETIYTDNYSYDGKTYNLYFSQYLTNASHVVTHKKENNTFKVTFTSATDNATQTQKYNAYTGVAYYYEGESFSSFQTQESNDNYSGHVGGRNIKNNAAVNIVTVPEAGTYKLTYALCRTNSSDNNYHFYKNNSESEIESGNATWSYNYIKSSGTLSVDNISFAANDILQFKADASTTVLDYVLLEKTYSYSVVDNLGNELARGSNLVNATIYYNVPQYIFSASRFYKDHTVSEGTKGSYFQPTFTLDADNKVITVTYTEEDPTNVIFFSEAESLTGASEKSDDGIRSRLSNGKAGYFSEKTAFTTLDKGLYSITSSTRSGATTFSAGSTNVLKISSGGSVSTVTKNFVVSADNTNIYVSAGSGSIYFDYVLIRQLYDQTSVDATLGTNGYATFASPYALDLTALPTGLTAYKAAVDGTTVTFTALNQTVPANTGILLQGDPSETYSIPVAADGTTVTENAFLVNESGTTFTGDDDYYYFGLIQNTLTFGQFTPSTVAIPANKAYLKVSKASIDSPSRALTVKFSDDATGINSIKSGEIKDNSVYNLSGQRVAQPTTGLYIMNGKKVFMR